MLVKLRPDFDGGVGAQRTPHVVALGLRQEIQTSLLQGFCQTLSSSVLAPFGTPAPTAVRSRLAHFLKTISINFMAIIPNVVSFVKLAG